MATPPLLSCPVCWRPGFPSVDSLRQRLVNAATHQLSCPICHDVLLGLDKFTIHLFSHQLVDAEQLHHHQHCVSNAMCTLTDATANTKDDVPTTTMVTTICTTMDNPLTTIGRATYTVATPINTVSSTVTTTTTSVHTTVTARCKTVNTVTITDMKQTIFTQHPNNKPLKHIQRGEWNNNKGKLENVVNKNEHGVIYSESHKMNNKSANVSELVCDGKLHKCELCQFSFPDPSILQIHHQLVHQNKDGAKSSVNTRGDSSAKRTDGRHFPCHLCLKAFKMRGSLMVHLRVAHGGNGAGKVNRASGEQEAQHENRSFVCSTCAKSFKKEQHLSQHMKTHEGKQWECDVCAKLFTTKYFLKKHKRLHTGEMPYSCTTCNKTFTFQQSYHKHLLYHSDDKPHVCTKCDRAFKELSTLHNHQRIHTGEKPFACETCANPICCVRATNMELTHGKCFRQRVSYLVHRRIHTGVMPYRCTACGKNFRYKVSQRTHKCPSQPPGTVVRQSGDLVQKLLQKASQESSMDTAIGSTTAPARDCQASLQFPENQFIIVFDSNLSHNLVMAPSLLVVPTADNLTAATDKTRPFHEDDGLDERAVVAAGQFGQMIDNQEPSQVSSEHLFSGENKEKRIQETFDSGQSAQGEQRHANILPHLDPTELFPARDGQDLLADTTDFFTMVMSPSAAGSVPSPSEGMRQLTLSPHHDEGLYRLFASQPTPSTEPLQTINEESLKQLLYGTTL